MDGQQNDSQVTSSDNQLDRSGEPGGGGLSSYNQGLASTTQTIGVATLIWNIVRSGASALQAQKHKGDAAQELKEKLGEWASESQDTQGRWRVPVLSIEPFEKHLVRNEAHFVPSGSFESSYAWAQLLYALNIQPGGGVIGWRLPERRIDPENDDISLEVDGPVMCHIINLYREYTKCAPKDFSPIRDDHTSDSDKPGRKPQSSSRTKRCRFPFGSLSLSSGEGGRLEAIFKPDSAEALSLRRVPLKCSIIARGHYSTIHFPKEQVVATYLSTLMEGQASDPEVVLPKPESPLKERLRSLLRALTIIGGIHYCNEFCEKRCRLQSDPNHKCHNSCEPKCVLETLAGIKEPLILTSAWIEEASRIKRRATTNGGHDEALIKEILSRLPDYEKHVCMQLVMHKHEQYGFSWNLIPRSMPEPLPSEKQLSSILCSIAEESKAPWLRSLVDTAPQLAQVMLMRSSIQNVPVVVLEMGLDHEVWGETCIVRG